MLPFLLMILHFSQIGFTDDLTFIWILLSSLMTLRSLGYPSRVSLFGLWPGVWTYEFGHKKITPHKSSFYSIALLFRKSKGFLRKYQVFFIFLYFCFDALSSCQKRASPENITCTLPDLAETTFLHCPYVFRYDRILKWWVILHFKIWCELFVLSHFTAVFSLLCLHYALVTK